MLGGATGSLRGPPDTRYLPTNKCNPSALIGTQVDFRTRSLEFLGIQDGISLR